MRLHLPKALLAACLAWPAGASTLTSETTTIGGVKYSGYVIEFVGTSNQNFHQGTYATKTTATDTTETETTGKTLTITNASEGTSTQFDAYSDGSVSTTAKQDLWKLFCSNSTFTHGHTLKLNSSASKNLTLTCDFSPITIGGIISTGSASSYTLASNGNRKIELSGKSASGVNMAIGVNTTLNANAEAIEIKTGGSWVISKGKSLTLSSTSTNGVTIASGQNVNVSASGDGTGNASLTFSGAVTNNGALNIGSNVLFSTSNTITNTGNISFASEATINLDSFQPTSTTLNDSDTTGVKTWTGSWTLATGGTVTTEDGVIYQYKGKSATGGSMSDGVISANGNYFNITSGDEKTYTEATADSSINFINVLGELSGLSGTISTAISGSGTLSMSAGSEQVTITADKLTDFTGNLVINSGRFNEVNNGHVFSNVSVANGGQFCINDSYNYTGNVSIAGTGWSNTSDYAWDGALRLGDGATLSGNLTLTGDANLIVYNGAKGTLSGTLDTGGHTLTVKGDGKLLFGSSVVIGSGEGNADIVAENAHIGVRNNGSLSILKNYTCKGLYSDGQGAITIGDATHTIVNSVERIELGDSGTSGKITTLTVSANSVLKITGTNNGDGYKTASALLGEWNARTTATINGTLLSEAAALQAGDTGYTLNIGSTGLVTAKGIQRAKSNNATIAVNLNGGSLILGETGIKAAGVTSTSTGGVIGSYADTTTIASGLSLTSGTTTIDTSKYTINTDNTVTVGENATGSTITINGIISGSGTLKVSGGGILVLNGNNTYTNETRLSGGEIQAGNANAFGTGKLIVDGDSSISGTATIADFVDVSNKATLTIKGGSAITLSNSTANKGMWIASGSSVALESGASITGYNVTVSYLNANSELAAEGADGGQFGTCGHTHENAITIKESAISLANGAVLRNKLDGGTVSSTGNTKIGWLENNSTYGGGSISSLEVTSGTLDVASDLAVTKSATIAGTLSIGEKATTAINSEREDGTASTIATLTGSGTLKATGGTTEATNASGFTGTLDAAGGSLTASGGIALLTAVKATGGDITLQGAANLALTEVVVSSGKTILAFTEDSNYVNFSAQDVRVGEGGGSLIGNLSIGNGGTLTLNAVDGISGTGLTLSYAVSTVADTGITTTSGSLTLGTGLTLNLLNINLKQNQSLTLFSGVTGVTGIDDMDALKSGSLEAKTIFTNLTAGDFNLSFDETNHIVALVAQRNVPEPTTAMLSLLALMGLAARRRRRKA